jgi:preprotein translocase subunit SecA
MIDFLRKLFDTSDRDIKTIQPIVEDINNIEAKVQELSDDELRNTTAVFRQRLADGEDLDKLLPEAFAVVRETSRRTLGMRQFDVQMLGGIVLHKGRIAEMKTGEGKTLVAVAPLYLNALPGKGAHLVTANDYLARRDAVWMGPIYHFLGLSLGIIQGQSADSDELGGSYIYDPEFHHDDPRYMHCRPCSRREAYLCDITYGTNHEFGFDYLRDNMAFDVSQLSQREQHFAIVDEVDSILIDEARTPHIISGPSMEDVSIYQVVDKVVRQMNPEIHYTSDKKNHSASLTEEGMDFVEELMEIDNIASDPRLFHHVNASVKAWALFEKNVDYVVRGTEVVIIDENTGRAMFGRRYSDGLHQALEAKENVPVQRESQTVAVITFQNLFRMYDKLAGMTGTAKTEEDEFRKIYGLEVTAVPTNRDMQRKDQADVVYKTMDAKFRGIAREILRLYTKQQPVLVGTRSVDMTEQVSARLTPDLLQRLLLTDRLLHQINNEKSFPKDKRKDANVFFDNPLDSFEMPMLRDFLAQVNLPGDALSDEIQEWFFKQQGLGKGNEEFFQEAIRHGVPHNVLNAKYHEREALIISEAGRKGAVTISTNMAGRGVDILLGGRVADETVAMARTQELEDGGLAKEYADTFLSFRRGGDERAAPPLPIDDHERSQLAEEVKALGGLFILGTERHESRRIDNQLRGRAGRQGDPGESRFFVSLEDQLWKIFNSKMIENPILKGWPTMEEVRDRFITGMILKTQERIENHFFEARKHVLEYDDVLNTQRETIYGKRRSILLGTDVGAEIQDAIHEFIGEAVDRHWSVNEDGLPVYDYDALYEELNDLFPLVDHASLSALSEIPAGEELRAFCIEKAEEAYKQKREALGDDVMGQLERHVMLRAVNDKWMEHLQMIEYIREGIGLRGYGQVDPLVAYKRETFDLFQTTLRDIRDAATKLTFQAEVRVEQQQPAMPTPQMVRMEDISPEALEAAGLSVGESSGEAVATLAPVSEADLAGIDWKRVGRNDLCPCGSGKKFKSCHYPALRQQGVI